MLRPRLGSRIRRAAGARRPACKGISERHALTEDLALVQRDSSCKWQLLDWPSYGSLGALCTTPTGGPLALVPHHRPATCNNILIIFHTELVGLASWSLYAKHAASNYKVCCGLFKYLALICMHL